jgi:putative ABC transport system permease protein
MQRIRLFLQLGQESFLMAINSLWANKLRSMLSLAGISIGIFCIILVWTFVDSMEANINKSFESLGQNVVYVQQWPWEFSSDYPWWKYMNRPRATLRESEMLKERLEGQSGIEAVDFMYRIYRKGIKAGSNSVDNISGLAVGHHYSLVNPVDIGNGRYFTESESRLGNPVIILGSSLAVNLFGDQDPVGKDVQIFGKKMTVIGVIKRKGKSILGNSEDDSILLPIQYYRKVTSLNRGGEPSILVKGAADVSLDDLQLTIQGIMRSIRRLGPRDDDNFAMNRITMLTKIISGIFSVLHTGGGIIGGFSILVGGFGIANIMFVSVKERTAQIGIQKAIGATNGFILFQFLTESILLSLFGGLIGVLFVFLGAKGISIAMDIEVQLSTYNFILSNVLSAVIGLLAGMIPALSAARMDPVEAMRAK